MAENVYYAKQGDILMVATSPIKKGKPGVLVDADEWDAVQAEIKEARKLLERIRLRCNHGITDIEAYVETLDADDLQEILTASLDIDRCTADRIAAYLKGEDHG